MGVGKGIAIDIGIAVLGRLWLERAHTSIYKILSRINRDLITDTNVTKLQDLEYKCMHYCFDKIVCVQKRLRIWHNCLVFQRSKPLTESIPRVFILGFATDFRSTPITFYCQIRSLYILDLTNNRTSKEGSISLYTKR